MAKTYGVNIDINTNSKETQKEFDRLRKSIAEATDEVNDLSKQFGENSKEADAAKKSLSELTLAYDEMTKEATDLGATFEDVYGEMKPLTGQMGEMEDRLYQMALAGDTSSQAYKDLLAEVGNYRRVQIETDLAVDGAAETLTGKLGKGLEGVTSGFAATQGAMALFGSENEALEKSLLKVQSALAIQQGVKGLRNSYRELGGATGIATTI
jgi:chromosome segregation ATPase